MKTTLLLLALALNATAAQPVLVRVTPATLARLQAMDPMIRVVHSNQTEITNPACCATRKESTVLHDGKNWTMVPNGALVYLPAAMKERVNAKPVGNLLPWNEFLKENRSWISTTEVTFDQAAGNAELPADCKECWAMQDKIVVTVHQDDPASVRIAPMLPALTSR